MPRKLLENLVLCESDTAMNNTKNIIGHYRWGILALFFFGTTINYIDRQVIGILKPFIAHDLGWSEVGYGFIITSFQVAYALGMIVSGWLLDKLGTRLGYLWAMAVWSLSAMAHAVASGVSSFIAARFALGIGESANFPAAVKGVAEWFPKKERAFATGLFNSGSTVGAILAPIIVSFITIRLGWRLAFLLTASLGGIWIIFWLLFYQLPSRISKISQKELEYIQQDKEVLLTERIKWKDLFKYRQTYIICITRFISDWVWWFFLFWVPDFLAKTQGINIKEIVLPLIVIYAVSSIGGITGGWTSSQFIKLGRTIDYSRKTTILLSAIIVLPVILVSYVHNLWFDVFIIAIAASGHQSWASNIFTIVSDIYPQNTVGSMVGLCGFAGAIGGALSASFIGLVIQVTHSFSLIFMFAAVVYLINWFLLKIFIPEISPIQVVSDSGKK
ncbi:MAG: MFS transporter [Acidobacterium ailaaui]|nr:MFS transporter [Pseudacidobacterium ailaaui]